MAKKPHPIKNHAHAQHSRDPLEKKKRGAAMHMSAPSALNNPDVGPNSNKYAASAGAGPYGEGFDSPHPSEQPMMGAFGGDAYGSA